MRSIIIDSVGVYRCIINADEVRNPRLEMKLEMCGRDLKGEKES